MAAALSIDADPFERELEDLMGQVGGRFRHRASRQRAREMIEALLAPVESKNCWTLAEHAGHASPDGFQYFLERARWDHEGAIEDLRRIVCGRLGDQDAVLVVDETGDLKKGYDTARNRADIE